MRRKDRESAVTMGSGNVFKDLGLPRPEEALAKADLIWHLSVLIESKGLTQVQAARIMGIDQPKVSALLAGHLSGFSTDRILRFLTALGADIEIGLRPAPKGRARGTLRVVGKGVPSARR